MPEPQLSVRGNRGHDCNDDTRDEKAARVAPLKVTVQPQAAKILRILLFQQRDKGVHSE